METEPNTANVAYIDEYPELRKRVWMRRLNEQRLSQVVELPRVIAFQRTPDDAA